MDQKAPFVLRTYSATASWLHWLVASAVLVMLPLGLAMTYRGNVLNLWDGLTEALYSSHKLIGFLLLWLMVGRLIYRVVHGAPADAPHLPRGQRIAAHLVHGLLYGLLLLVPLLGWLGVSLFPATGIFGLFNLPSLAAPNEAQAGRVLGLHGTLALVTSGIVALHIAAALYHGFIRRDGVLRRMWPHSR